MEIVPPEVKPAEVPTAKRPKPPTTTPKFIFIEDIQKLINSPILKKRRPFQAHKVASPKSKLEEDKIEEEEEKTNTRYATNTSGRLKSRNWSKSDTKPERLALNRPKVGPTTQSTVKIPLVPKTLASTKRQTKIPTKGSSLVKRARK